VLDSRLAGTLRTRSFAIVNDFFSRGRGGAGKVGRL